MGEVCSRHAGDGRCTQNFSWKHRSENTTWKSRHKWDDNINVDLTEIRWKVWIEFI